MAWHGLEEGCGGLCSESGFGQQGKQGEHLHLKCSLRSRLPFKHNNLVLMHTIILDNMQYIRSLLGRHSLHPATRRMLLRPLWLLSSLICYIPSSACTKCARGANRPRPRLRAWTGHCDSKKVDRTVERSSSNSNSSSSSGHAQRSEPFASAGLRGQEDADSSQLCTKRRWRHCV